MKLFTKAFWVTALENSLVTGASTFAGSLVLTTTPTLKGLVAAASTGGMAALYTFVKQVGAVQAANATANSKP